MANYFVTGGAGFIGSHLVRFLLERGDSLVVYDNFSTGSRENLSEIRDDIQVIEGDICDQERLTESIQQSRCDGIFHLAALGSVSRSLEDPMTTMQMNVTGTACLLDAARRLAVRRVVFSSSSSVYGDQLRSPKVETMAVAPLSPYAVSKTCGEVVMSGFARSYRLETVSLRYFNVFGPRQNPLGPYAAVIPAFISAFLEGRSPIVYGDGTQTRDFCYVDNVVLANCLAMTAPASRLPGSNAGDGDDDAKTRSNISPTINIACGQAVSLNDILEQLRLIFRTDIPAVYSSFRSGDVRHSLADIGRASELLGYCPLVKFPEGLERTARWFQEHKRNY